MSTTNISKALKERKESMDGPNLQEHLKNILVKLLFDNPKDALARFQEYSFTYKGTKQEQIVLKVKEGFNHLKEYEQKNRALLEKINTGTEEEPQQPAAIGFVPNVVDENSIFERAGVGLGEEEAYRIYKSLSKLSVKKSAKQVRLWGKILTSTSDYYIAEGIADGGDEFPDMPTDTEPKGSGVNKFTYWATTKLSGDWSELPVVTPQQLRTSRKIKVLLSGDLNRKIISNPHFLGKESHLLKCQIVRINTSCTVVPKGMYSINPDDAKEIVDTEEWKCPDAKTLGRIENWVHHPQAILKAGRLLHTKPEGLEPEEEEKAMKQLERKDPYQPRLKAISNDNWKVSSFRAENESRQLSKDTKPINYATVCLKNLIWPGWTTCHHLGRTISIYVGYGFKASQTYYPCQPEAILQEQKDRPQVTEPN